MQYYKLQMGCMMILLYIAFLYWKERGKYHKKHKPRVFDYLLVVGIISVLFDGITAHTVNHPDVVAPMVNMICHMFFLLSFDTLIFLLFLYMRAITDVILQKPGKLTDEEFEAMKQHAAKGGEIIRETFGHLENKEFTQMAYEVARYHHEKWNGKGYPDGLKRKEIPLCARIMAIADVFDAVSEKRCYRDAMPLEKCLTAKSV